MKYTKRSIPKRIIRGQQAHNLAGKNLPLLPRTKIILPPATPCHACSGTDKHQHREQFRSLLQSLVDIQPPRYYHTQQQFTTQSSLVRGGFRSLNKLESKTQYAKKDNSFKQTSSPKAVFNRSQPSLIFLSKEAKANKIKDLSEQLRDTALNQVLNFNRKKALQSIDLLIESLKAGSSQSYLKQFHHLSAILTDSQKRCQKEKEAKPVKAGKMRSALIDFLRRVRREVAQAINLSQNQKIIETISQLNLEREQDRAKITTFQRILDQQQNSVQLQDDKSDLLEVQLLSNVQLLAQDGDQLQVVTKPKNRLLKRVHNKQQQQCVLQKSIGQKCHSNNQAPLFCQNNNQSFLFQHFQTKTKQQLQQELIIDTYQNQEYNLQIYKNTAELGSALKASAEKEDHAAGGARTMTKLRKYAERDDASLQSRGSSKSLAGKKQRKKRHEKSRFGKKNQMVEEALKEFEHIKAEIGIEKQAKQQTDISKINTVLRGVFTMPEFAGLKTQYERKMIQLQDKKSRLDQCLSMELRAVGQLDFSFIAGAPIPQAEDSKYPTPLNFQLEQAVPFGRHDLVFPFARVQEERKKSNRGIRYKRFKAKDQKVKAEDGLEGEQPRRGALVLGYR